MDGSDVKFLAPGAPQGSKFEITQGVVSMEGRSLGFHGFGGIRHLSLGAGWSFDLTSGIGGADQLHLSGLSEGYCASIKGNELTLIHVTQRTAVKLAAGRGPGRLVFEDGFVGVGDLWRNMAQAAALSRLTGESGFMNSATVASYVHPGRDEVFLVESHALPEGALLSVASLDRVESVYEPEVAASICLEGAFSDYGVTIQGEVLALDRQVNGRVEGVYLVGAAELTFSDGSVSVSALREVLQPHRMESVWGDSFPRQAEDPVATSVALSIEPSTISCSESWFGGLFHGGMLSRLCVGQVFEVAVSFGEAMCVWGAPQVQLRLGRLERMAQYRGRSGCDTLRFTYVVTEDDVLETSLNGADGSGGRTEPLRLDIEVGELVLCHAEIHPFSGLRYRQTARADERGHPATSDYHRLLRERAGFRMKVDVDLDELERVDEVLCH